MNKISRREFIRVSALTAAGLAVAACAKETPVEQEATATPVPEADEPTATPVPQAEPAAKESPILTGMVEAGDLEPLEERIPSNPYVASQGMLVEDDLLQIEIGEFGGTMRLAQENAGGDPHIYIGKNEQLIWAPGGFDYDAGIHGSVVESWEQSEDSTLFTFHMRPGLKWSDGEPVTTEDVQFSFEDVLHNEEISPVFPRFLRTGNSATGNMAELSIIDDYTFSLTFDEPYGSFPAMIAIAGWRSYADFMRPKHYLTQFHIDYTPLEELQTLMEEESIEEDQWYNLFNDRQIGGNLWKANNEGGIGHPMLTPWVITQAESGVFIQERNAYYFKVDAEGNQLPYIDGLRSDVVQDKETLTARALMGEFDYLGERASLKKLALMKEEEEKGNIKVLIPRMHRLPINFSLNLSYPDPVWREVVGDKRFRQALSFAINREEILKNFYLGQFASLPTRSNPAEYNVEKANELLDEMGLDQKDGEGYRLGPDGNRFEILFELRDLSEDHIPMGELIAEYWKEVGVFTSAKAIDSALYGPRWNANEIQASALWAHETIWPSGGWDDYLPGNSFSLLWQQWYNSGGETGEEPPPEAKALYENHEKFLKAAVGSPDSEAALGAIYESYVENVWTFNPVEDSSYPTFFTVRMHNVPVGEYEGLGISIMHHMEQWYIKE
jgi:peptide/nickel transport system substrate-binding protein